MGGQISCYSSLGKALTPPPIPDTLLQETLAGIITGTGTASLTAAPHYTSTFKPEKPTSAIVNIAYAMQYPVVSLLKEELPKNAKIGIGVVVSGAAVLIGMLVWLLIRKVSAARKGTNQLQEHDVSQRFGAGVDMSRVAHEPPPPPPMSTTYGGAKYATISTRGI